MEIRIIVQSQRNGVVDFLFGHQSNNKWIFFIVLAAITGAISGLYDKYLMKSLNPMLVQSWYNVYQVFIMCPILLCLKSIPSFFPERLNIKKEAMASITPIH